LIFIGYWVFEKVEKVEELRRLRLPRAAEKVHLSFFVSIKGKKITLSLWFVSCGSLNLLNSSTSSTLTSVFLEEF